MTAKRTLVSCLKDEGPFLLEWLAYHKAIGFDRFIIGANDCTDGSAEILSQLQDLGEVTYIPFTKPQDKGAQNTFAQILDNADLIDDGDWVCWLDLDEFLNIHLGEGRLGDLLGEMGAADVIRVNWRIFGVDATTPWPGRQLHPDLCRCAVPDFGVTGPYPGHRTFKTLYRYQKAMRCTPHAPKIDNAALIKAMTWLNGSGTEVRHRIWPHWLVRPKPGKIPVYTDGKPQHEWAQINHYMTRHPQLTTLRKARGRGGYFVPSDPSKPGSEDFTDRHSQDFFARYNRTEDEDRSILRQLTTTDAAMDELLRDPVLRSLHDAAQERLQSHISAQ